MKKRYIVLYIIVMLIALSSMGYGIYKVYTQSQQTKEAEDIVDAGKEVYNQYVKGKGDLWDNEQGNSENSSETPTYIDEEGVVHYLDTFVTDGKGLIHALQTRYNNTDVVAYLVIDAYDLYTPILWHEGDYKYYLRHNIYGEYSYNGSIYLDSDCCPDFQNAGNMIYGHNMLDGMMFGRLEKEISERGIEGVEVVIYTDSEKLVYKPIIYGPVAALDRGFYVTQEEPEEGFFVSGFSKKYGKQCPEGYDNYLTLMTCYYKDSSRQRFCLTCGLVSRTRIG